MAMIEITKKDYDDIEAKMQKCIDNLQENLNTIRAGRANPHVLDKITVDYYGAPSPLNAVANIQVPEARMITLAPWDPKMLRDIEHAIQASDLGINPTNDGNVVRLTFPQLTEDRRKELAKEIKGLGEKAKVTVRNVRRDTMEKLKKMKKNSEITEDELADAEKKVQKITDGFCDDIDKAVADKEKEIMTV